MTIAPKPRKWTVTLATLALVFLSSGCHVNKVDKRDVAQVPQPPREHLVGITTKSGEEIQFDEPGGTIDQSAIEARVNNMAFRIETNDVQRLWVERRELSSSRTIGLAVGIAAASLVTMAAIYAATKQSCPFIYSWDGARYVFDAEPYGGAITRGLERDDFSELENLREQDGVYRLRITNEVDETQYTNFMELWIVDHPSGSRVISDEHGALRSFDQIQMLTSAVDRDGNDLTPWLRTTDRLIWEPDAIAAPDGNLRQEVVLSFAKPQGATHVDLIANAATGIWGSYMIKKIVELHGRDTSAWLASLDQNPAGVEAIHAWGEREGTYRLPIEVKEDSGWVVRGALPNGGPLLAEDRAISLDVSQSTGTELQIRLLPPVGFWAFNSFAVSYGSGEAVDIIRVEATSAQTSEGKDILPDLAAADERYYRMPELTDRAELVFPAPMRRDGQERTAFLHSRGWYALHLRDESAPDLTTFNQIMTTPGAAVQFAADRYAEWRSGTVR